MNKEIWKFVPDLLTTEKKKLKIYTSQDMLEDMSCGLTNMTQKQMCSRHSRIFITPEANNQSYASVQQHHIMLTAFRTSRNCILQNGENIMQ